MTLPEYYVSGAYLLLAFHNIHLMNVCNFKAQLQNHQLESLRAREPTISEQHELRHFCNVEDLR